MSSSDPHFEFAQGLTNKSRSRLCISACLCCRLKSAIAPHLTDLKGSTAHFMRA